jgi:hypothetical protein
MQQISSEFAGFVRDTGVRAFDLLSERTKELPTALRPILRAWTKLTETQKNDLFGELLGLIQGGTGEPVPAKKKTRKKTASKKSKKS